ncbi:MAG: hypothetical protein U0V73_09125 [Acidimicrobiia bacterium]
MAPSPDWKQFLDAGMRFTEVRRKEARKLANDLVEQGQLAQERVQSFVDDLVEASRARTDQLVELVRKEVQRQIRALNLVTREDLPRLTARLTGRPATRKAARKPAAKKAGAKKKAAKKPAAKKPAAKKTAAKKPAAKKPAAKKAAAKKAAAKKGSVGKKTTAANAAVEKAAEG